jgi:Ca2+-binding RTX toxin-like protein
MAAYMHFEIPNSPTTSWAATLGTNYVANSTQVVITNFDGTRTWLIGNFAVFGGFVTSGSFASMKRTDASSATTYESITGVSVNAFNFLTAADGDAKFAMVLSGTDFMTGHSGDDVLNGRGGPDTMQGGAGDDGYFVDNLGDVVLEAADAGRDRVTTTLLSYTLPQHFEDLSYLGSKPFTGIGNDAANTMTGGFGFNTLFGLGGDDYLLSSGPNNSLRGGLGDDRYSVSHPGDIVVELANEGRDRIETTSGAYSLENLAHVEDLAFIAMPNGTPPIGTGNALDNTITSGFLPSVFHGLGGNDELSGGSFGGNKLYGDQGNDALHVGHNDLLDGGDDDDTAVFVMALDKYALTDLGSQIVEKVGLPGFKLVSVEHLRFADGTIDVVDGNPLFDTVHYMSHNLDVFHAGVNALEHFNASGRYEGRNPNAFFDTAGYLAVNKDVASGGMNPLEHYAQFGWHEGRDPGAQFDVRLYLIHNPDVAAAGIDPLTHYLQSGMAEGRKAWQAVGENISGGFDAQYYLFRNPDVAAANVDPLQHYYASGWHEGRNPNAWFDSAGYLAHYADVAAAGANPLQHYMQFGWQEGRDPSAGFDTLGYLANNPDVAAAHVNPLEHFLINGIYEGRQAGNDGVWH